MFWDIYIRLCQSKGKSANAVARELSIASGTVTEWKRGRTPQNATLKRIADYFGVSVEYLLGSDGEKATRANESTGRHGLRVPVYERIVKGEPIEVVAAVDVPDAEAISVPIHGTDTVAAGIPLSMIGDVEDYEEIPGEMAGEGEFAALRICDDSMEPRMQAGDVVIVRIKSEAADGETVVAFVPDREEAICRRVKKMSEGILLLATNPRYEPIFCSESQLAAHEARILGRVVELRAKY